MSSPDPEQLPRPDEDADFAEEHTRPTFEDEPGDPSGAGSDESVPEGPAGEERNGEEGPL